MKANNYDTYLFFQNMKIGMYSFQRYVYQSNRAILLMYNIVTYNFVSYLYETFVQTSTM